MSEHDDFPESAPVEQLERVARDIGIQRERGESEKSFRRRFREKWNALDAGAATKTTARSFVLGANNIGDA